MREADAQRLADLRFNLEESDKRNGRYGRSIARLILERDELRQKLVAAAEAICPRCAWEEDTWQVVPGEEGEYVHSACVTSSGVGIPPEPCAASHLWAILATMPPPVATITKLSPPEIERPDREDEPCHP